MKQAMSRSICARTMNNAKKALNKSFDKLRTNGKLLIPFVVSLSNHERNPFIQRFPKLLRVPFAEGAKGWNMASVGTP